MKHRLDPAVTQRAAAVHSALYW